MGIVMDEITNRRKEDLSSLMYTLGKIDGKVDTIIATQGDLVHRVKHLEESRADHTHINRLDTRVDALEGKLGKITLVVVAMSAGSGGLSAAFLQGILKLSGVL